MNVLLLEDDELVSQILKVKLSELGHFVVHAISDKNLEALCISHNFDLIISDIMLPNNSGISAIKRLQLNKDFDIPVIFISGIEHLDLYVKNRNVKYHSFIYKPFAVDTLIAHIDKLKPLKKVVLE
jgi:DNA-binding response OmpR family regulator